MAKCSVKFVSPVLTVLKYAEFHGAGKYVYIALQPVSKTSSFILNEALEALTSGWAAGSQPPGEVGRAQDRQAMEELHWQRGALQRSGYLPSAAHFT